MVQLRSNISTKGRKMAGARSLWRANGMKEEQFGKPIIAIANSFTQFVPGHAHLHHIGQYVKGIIESRGCFAAEFNTIAIDDGIAMGHDGMLYSLPSRDLIADSVEYMCNAHKADALICISNCDKITPGMLMAAMRMNIPAIFVSGGPMEAGRLSDKKIDLIDAMIMGGNEKISEEELNTYEQNACPTCGSCSGMFTANSMNCLTEALGMAFPGNGTLVATHINRLNLFEKAANRIVEMANQYYFNNDESVLPRSICSRQGFLNAMSLDIAMGGSTNTILHLLAIASEAEVDFSLRDIDELSKKIPCLCKVAPSSHFHVEDVHRAGGIMTILGILESAGLIDGSTGRIDYSSLSKALSDYVIDRKSAKNEAFELYQSGPAGKPNLVMGSQNTIEKDLDTNRKSGCIRDIENAYHKDGGLAILFGNISRSGAVIKTAGVDASMYNFKGPAIVFSSQEEAMEGILNDQVKEGQVVVIRYEGPKGGPGMQEMLYPTSFLKSRNLDKKCALITDGRFSGGTAGLSVGHISPEAASQGEIALIRDGDIIEIDIKTRSLNVLLSDEDLNNRRKEELEKGRNAFKPLRNRNVSQALKFYALHVSSADKGAVRLLVE